MRTTIRDTAKAGQVEAAAQAAGADPGDSLSYVIADLSSSVGVVKAMLEGNMPGTPRLLVTERREEGCPPSVTLGRQVLLRPLSDLLQCGDQRPAAVGPLAQTRTTPACGRYRGGGWPGSQQQLLCRVAYRISLTWGFLLSHSVGGNDQS